MRGTVSDEVRALLQRVEKLGEEIRLIANQVELSAVRSELYEDGPDKRACIEADRLALDDLRDAARQVERFGREHAK